MFHSIRWKRHRTVVLALAAGLLVLTVACGGTRVSAITSSERHQTDAFVSTDIKGRTALFDNGQPHTVALSFAPADYERLIAAFKAEGEKAFIEASVTIDGTTISPVGLRLKGNSTLMGLRRGGGGGPGGGNVSADNPDSLPWLISFDEYRKGQRYQGYKEIAIRPVLASKTGLNEALALALIGRAGQPTQRTTYAAFSINGGAAALRLVLEIPGDNYAEDNFAHDGVLYKALSTGKFADLGDDPLAYQNAFKQITRKKQQDTKPLIDLLQWVNGAPEAEFAARLDAHVDVDAFARYIALQTLLNNFDDMAGPGQNYYLWYDLATRKFSVLTWDMNLAFGQRGFGGGGFGNPGGAGAPPAGGGFGGRGGNALKSRFQTSAAFKERYARAYGEMYAALYGGGAALAELDRLAAVVARGNLLPAATVEGDVAALRAAIKAQASRGPVP